MSDKGRQEQHEQKTTIFGRLNKQRKASTSSVSPASLFPMTEVDALPLNEETNDRVGAADADEDDADSFVVVKMTALSCRRKPALPHSFTSSFLALPDDD
jgi:hypothetical protein